MKNPVTQWYEDKKNVDEMRHWNPALKEWERSVIGFFPAGAKNQPSVESVKSLGKYGKTAPFAPRYHRGIPCIFRGDMVYFSVVFVW